MVWFFDRAACNRVMPNTHRRHRRDVTVELSRVGTSSLHWALHVADVLSVFAELGQSVAKVSAVSQLVPIFVGDGLRHFDRRVEVPVARRELASFLKIQRLRVGRNERAELLPELLVAILESLRRLLLCNAKAKFHYADFPWRPRRPEKFRGSRRNGIWAKGDVTGLSRTCRGRHGKVDIVEYGLNGARQNDSELLNTRVRQSRFLATRAQLCSHFRT